MMFSSHMDMIYKNSALQDLFVNITEHKSHKNKKFPGLAWWILLFSVYFPILSSKDDILRYFFSPRIRFGTSKVGPSYQQLVGYTAVFSVVTQRSSADDTKNGCVVDFKINSRTFEFDPNYFDRY